MDGISFTIVTDCNSLTLTLSKKLINSRIAKWALELENYDYTIRHRRGELMSHNDALIRAPVIAIIEGDDIEYTYYVNEGQIYKIFQTSWKQETWMIIFKKRLSV